LGVGAGAGGGVRGTVAAWAQQRAVRKILRQLYRAYGAMVLVDGLHHADRYEGSARHWAVWGRGGGVSI